MVFKETMFCLCILQEKHREFNKELHMVFVDLKKFSIPSQES